MILHKERHTQQNIRIENPQTQTHIKQSIGFQQKCQKVIQWSITEFQ